MLLFLEDEHKAHLDFLRTSSLDVVREFCRISIEFLRKGVNPKVYQTAAQKLGVEPLNIQNTVKGLMFLLLESSKLDNDVMNETYINLMGSSIKKLGVEPLNIQNTVEGLMFLLLESSKLVLNKIDFCDSVKTLGFSEELQLELYQQYAENQADIRRIESFMSASVPHYRDLQWRLDIQLASRSLRHQVEPIITLKLHTTVGDDVDVQVLQTDPVNLVHMTRTLEEALQDLNSAHCRRICRNF